MTMDIRYQSDMAMELHQLRYFVAVAETGSFTRAAEREGVTQPTLSEQILRLEGRPHGVGRRLFDRLGRKVVLTDAGHELLGHAQSILAAVGEAERAVRDSAEGGLLPSRRNPDRRAVRAARRRDAIPQEIARRFSCNSRKT